MKYTPASKQRAAMPRGGPKGARKSSKRTPTFRKLQEKRSAGPREFRQNAAREAEQAERAAKLAREREEADARVRAELRQRRRERADDLIKLSDMTVGMELSGVVHNVVRHGAFVDVGATRDGLVHVRDMSVRFVSDPTNLVRTGDELTVWVKYVDAAANILALTMRRPLDAERTRTPVADVRVGERVEGTVARVTNYGAYIDIGAERLAFLHVNSLWGRRPRDTLDDLTLGRPIWIVVADVDEVRSFIRLNARGRRELPLDAQGSVVEDAPSAVTDGVTRNFVLARPGREIEDDDDSMRAIGSAERAMLLAKEKARDELLMEKVGPAAQTESWDGIRDMFDDNTEFVDMDSSEEDDESDEEEET